MGVRLVPNSGGLREAAAPKDFAALHDAAATAHEKAAALHTASHHKNMAFGGDKNAARKNTGVAVSQAALTASRASNVENIAASKAMDAAHAGKHTQAASLHQKAAKAHQQAAQIVRSSGSMKEANPHHVPAGSPEGGRFAPAQLVAASDAHAKAASANHNAARANEEVGKGITSRDAFQHSQRAADNSYEAQKATSRASGNSESAKFSQQDITAAGDERMGRVLANSTHFGIASHGATQAAMGSHDDAAKAHHIAAKLHTAHAKALIAMARNGGRVRESRYVTPSYAVSRVGFRESNDCHNPSGDGGGQFCSGDGKTHDSLDAAKAHAENVFAKTGAVVSVERSKTSLMPGASTKAASSEPPVHRGVTLTPEHLSTLDVSGLAGIVSSDWRKQKGGVNYAAAPYLDAMHSLSKVSDNYGADDGRGILHYFLGNATSWRGPVAKAVKAELKRRLK